MVTQENSSERLCWPNLFNLLHDGSWWFMMVGNGIIKSILSLTNKYNPAGETERCWQGCHQSHLGSCSGFWNIFFWCGATCQIFLCDRWWGGEVVPTRPDHLPGLGGTWHPFLCSDIIITSSSHHQQYKIENCWLWDVRPCLSSYSDLTSCLLIWLWSDFYPTYKVSDEISGSCCWVIISVITWGGWRWYMLVSPVTIRHWLWLDKQV